MKLETTSTRKQSPSIFPPTLRRGRVTASSQQWRARYGSKPQGWCAGSSGRGLWILGWVYHPHLIRFALPDIQWLDTILKYGKLTGKLKSNCCWVFDCGSHIENTLFLHSRLKGRKFTWQNHVRANVSPEAIWK